MQSYTLYLYSGRILTANLSSTLNPCFPHSICIFDHAVPSGSPLNLDVRTIDSTTIELVWTEPPIETHNGIIVSYFINISVSNTKTSFVVNATTAAPLNITELHPYYGYSLRVAAVTSQGAGPFSEAVSITTPEDGECKTINSLIWSPWKSVAISLDICCQTLLVSSGHQNAFLYDDKMVLMFSIHNT